jgi:hypothetical protein
MDSITEPQIIQPVDLHLEEQLPARETTKSRQDEIADILRNSATALRRDELIAEWVEIEREAKVGQIDHPPAGGVQKNDKGIAKAARELPVPGKSEDGRRKFIERSLQIAGICRQAKDAAISAGLENNRMELLNVAKEKAPEKQIAMVRRIVERRQVNYFEKLARKAASASSHTPTREIIPPERAGSQAIPTPDEIYSALVDGWYIAPPEVQERFAQFVDTQRQANGG